MRCLRNGPWQEAVQVRTPTPDGQNWFRGRPVAAEGEKKSFNCSPSGGLVYTLAGCGKSRSFLWMNKT
jgi:hypothetical protein